MNNCLHMKIYRMDTGSWAYVFPNRYTNVNWKKKEREKNGRGRGRERKRKKKQNHSNYSSCELGRIYTSQTVPIKPTDQPERLVYVR